LALLLGVAAVSTVLLLWGATWAGRVALSPPAPLAAVVIVLPHLYGLVALGCLLAWRPGGSRRLAPVALFTLLASALALWGWPWLPHRDRGGERSLTLLTWNVGRMGEFELGAARAPAEAQALDCIAATMARWEPDVVALLEVSGPRLADLSAARDLDCIRTDYYGTGRYTAGGLAVCVPQEGSWQLSQRRSLELPPDWKYVYTELQREQSTLNFLAVHFSPYMISEDLRRKGVWQLLRHARSTALRWNRRVEEIAALQGEQAQKLEGVLRSFRDPTIIAGDFNGTRDARVHRDLRRSMYDAWERGGWGFGATRYLGGALPLRIDYVYASREAFAVRRAEVLDDTCGSDHHAVLAELGLRGE